MQNSQKQNQIKSARNVLNHANSQQSPKKFVITTHRDPFGSVQRFSASKPQSPKCVPLFSYWSKSFDDSNGGKKQLPQWGANFSEIKNNRFQKSQSNNKGHDHNKLQKIKSLLKKVKIIYDPVSLRMKDSPMMESPIEQDMILEQDCNISIQNGLSPGLISSQSTLKQIPDVKQYISSKQLIYKENKHQMDDKLQIYKTALWKMIKQNDENELMDFDRRYYRSMRQKRLQQIIKALLRKSRDLQISLQDLIDNKITQTKPFQQQGSYTFIYYVKKGMLDSIENMLQTNPLYVHDFDEKSMTPLHIAVCKENVAVVKMLLTYNASILSKDLFGNTPLGNAIKQNHIQIIQLFLSIQCPSDVQYAIYCKMTRNQIVHNLLRNAKLKDLLVRSSRFPEVYQFISKLLNPQ